MSGSVFSLRGLEFSYGKDRLFDGLDLEVAEGCITTIIGANGCGKTTLFNLMTKSLKPACGTIEFRGVSLSDIRPKEYARSVAIVHQYNTAPDDLSVEKLVGYGRTPHHAFGMSSNPEQDEEKIAWALRITQLEELKDMPISDLSGGQKQRAWIAMALAQDASVLFLDEPTTYLDVRYQLQILKLIQQLNRDFNMTIVMVLHDINQSLYYSDQIIALKEGRVIGQGSPHEIITSDLVREVYDVDLEVQHLDGRPLVLPI